MKTKTYLQKGSPMKQHDRIHPRLRLRWLSALLALCLIPLPAQADPVLSGNLNDLFVVQPDDCPDCTAGELDTLQEGLNLLLARLRLKAVNPFGEVCVAEASLTRDMAVLTFDLFRNGTISQNRWKDFLKAKAQIAGGMSNVTKNAMIQTALEKIADDVGIEIPADSLVAGQLEIHAAAQLSRLFERMAEGVWEPQEWQTALSCVGGGYNPVVDAVLAVPGPGRQQIDQILLASRPDKIWRDGELWHLTNLPADFEVGSVPASRDQIKAAYEEAIKANTWTTMVSGCGIEASYGLRERALEASEGYTFAAEKNDDSRGEGDPLDDDPGGTGFGDVITVIGKDPGRPIIIIIWPPGTTGGTNTNSDEEELPADPAPDVLRPCDRGTEAFFQTTDPCWAIQNLPADCKLPLGVVTDLAERCPDDHYFPPDGGRYWPDESFCRSACAFRNLASGPGAAAGGALAADWLRRHPELLRAHPGLVALYGSLGAAIAACECEQFGDHPLRP